MRDPIQPIRESPEELSPPGLGRTVAQMRGDWLAAAAIDLTRHPDVLAELRAFADRGVTYLSYRSGQFDHGPAFKALMHEISSRLHDLEIGGVVLDIGAEIHADPQLRDLARLLTMVIGENFGEFITINKGEMSGTPFFPITVSQDPADKDYVGNGKNSKRIGAHTDGSGVTDRRLDFMALVCVQRAETGGASLVTNALKVYHALPPEIGDHLINRRFIRQNPYNEASPNPARRPVFERVDNEMFSGMGIAYHRQRIENGHGYMREALTELDIRALDALDGLLNDSRFQAQFQLRSGQILMLNNHFMCHDRTAFTDSATYKRRLERFWAGAMFAR